MKKGNKEYLSPAMDSFFKGSALLWQISRAATRLTLAGGDLK